MATRRYILCQLIETFLFSFSINYIFALDQHKFYISLLSDEHRQKKMTNEFA